MEKKVLMSGNEAIARGAYEAGITFASAYPGTPSTEILESYSKYEGTYAEWAPNEKVALEFCIGCSIGGAKSLTAMKHVGLNVAADPLFTLAYTGTNGGLVIVTADDPDMHSSQNEQDNRHYARAAHIPMLEPSDSQEAKLMVIEAVKISETFNVPVMLRTTTRISHSIGVVSVLDSLPFTKRKLVKDVKAFVPVPAYARLMKQALLSKTTMLENYSNKSQFNFAQEGGEIGVICSGISYQYVKEVANKGVSVLKLGMTWPLPFDLIAEFCKGKKLVYIVEELDRFLETEIKANIKGVTFLSKPNEYLSGELNPDKVKAILRLGEYVQKVGKPGRPPRLCPGCSHRGMFHVLSKLKRYVTGDIGCYTLGFMPPFEALHTVICMGASIGNASGISKVAASEIKGKVVAVIGDSTFIHSGITGLIETVYNSSNMTVMVANNKITAMTGSQPNPVTGLNIYGQNSAIIDIKKLCESVGVKFIREVDAYSPKAISKAILEADEHEGVSVIIVTGECVMVNKHKKKNVIVDQELCKSCKLCLAVGCDAISFSEKASINPYMCNGCGVCEEVCPFGVIKESK